MFSGSFSEMMLNFKALRVAQHTWGVTCSLPDCSKPLPNNLPAWSCSICNSDRYRYNDIETSRDSQYLLPAVLFTLDLSRLTYFTSGSIPRIGTISNQFGGVWRLPS